LREVRVMAMKRVCSRFKAKVDGLRKTESGSFLKKRTKKLSFRSVPRRSFGYLGEIFR
jgi:hypothetical protein